MYMLVPTATSVLSGSQSGALCSQCSNSRTTETSPLGSLQQSENLGCIIQSFPSLPRDKLGTEGFLSVGWCCARGKRLWWEGALSFPTGFDVYGFALTKAAGPSHLVSGSLTNGIGLCVTVVLMGLWEEGGSQAFYSAILWISLRYYSSYWVLRVLYILQT